jgi:NTE family protein
MPVRQIAIACQGGGTHAAFTWGVLDEILAAKERFDADPEGGDRFEITAVSGTSAGALCALATWYGMAPNTADPAMGSLAAARERLEHLWTTFAATTPAEVMHNEWVAAALRWQAGRMPTVSFGPYDPLTRLSMAGLSLMGVRDEYLGFPALLRSLCPHLESVDWPEVARRRLRVVAGAIEVLSGNTEIFDSDTTLAQMGLLRTGEYAGPGANRWRVRRPLSLEGVAASGTLPEVLPAQVIEDMEFPTCEPDVSVRRPAYYWDGLYSQNPPVRDLVDAPTRDQKPDEIWVIRINPQEYSPRRLHVSLDDIHDRENDLAGNLSLNQELDHILTMNRWLARHGDAHPPLDTRKHVEVRTLKMSRETAWGIGHASKLDRGAAHIARMREEGHSIGRAWITDWRRLGPDFERYPDDARYADAPAELPVGASAGGDQ